VRASRASAFVKQDNQLFLDLTVRENLELGAYLVPEAAGRDRVGTHAGFLPQLEDKLDRAAGSLKRGRAAGPRDRQGIDPNAELLLVDEPSAGVSAGSLRIFEELFQRLRALHIPIVLVEQHLGFGTSVADRAVILRLGRVQHELSTEQLRADPDCVAQALTGEMY
jgi:branched-chain amino acid transport system ATP-binding protein